MEQKIRMDNFVYLLVKCYTNYTPETQYLISNEQLINACYLVI